VGDRICVSSPRSRLCALAAVRSCIVFITGGLAPNIRLRVRRFVQRAAHFVKPPPVYKPLTVDQLLDNQRSKDIIDQFSDLYYSSGTSLELNWRGDSILKNPCDLWMIVELLQRVKPGVLIETGTHRGGSASFYADMLRLLDVSATVITIDINPKWSFDPADKGIVSIVGYSSDESVQAQVKYAVEKALAKRPGPVMAMLDSAHDEASVSQELAFIAPFISVGSYLIVEDTNVNGHPSAPDFGPGPWEAVDKFLASRTDFVPDRECERFLLTFFPRGWLKRVR
jgi:cephalosporin hydroxylase